METTDRLRQLMRDATIDEFAESLGETATRLKDVLRGKQRPPADMLVKIHDRYGTDLNWLLCGEGKAGSALSPKEVLLVELYRCAPTDASRDAIIATARAFSPTAPELAPATKRARVNQIVHGDVGQQIAGDVVNHGPINVGGGRVRRSK